MKQILGLHIGKESIGWALIRQSTSPRIVNMGTRIFSSFVNYLGDGEREISKASIRTHTRSARKVYLRKLYRKQKMLSFLVRHGLCPLSVNELKKYIKKNLRPSDHTKMKQWFALNPYELRAKGVTEMLTKHELGRVLYHMSQRRGKSISNLNTTTKTLLEGLPSVNRVGVNETQHHLQDKLLGSYLHELLPEKNKPYRYSTVRARNRYLDRNMYKNEIESLFEEQQRHHKFLDENFKNIIIGEDSNSGIIFYQRPSQYRKLRGVASTCQYENSKKAMWQSHPINEWYNIYCWLDSIRLNGEPLNDDQRKKALDVAVNFSGFMFKKVRVALGIEDHFALNYEDASKIYLANTISHLSRNTAFGKKFLAFTDEEQHELWHDLHFYSNKELLTERLRDRWGLSLRKAKVVVAIKLKPGFGKLSMKAARSILYYLRQGCSLNNAIILGGVKNAIGKERWDSLDKETVATIDYFVEAAIAEKEIDNSGWISDFSNFFGIQLNPQKLYMIEQYREHNSLSKTPDDDREIIRKFKPVAQKPIFELRKLINNLINEYGNLDQINFVLSNDVKMNAKNRKAVTISKKIREQELPKIYDAVLAEGQNPTHTNLFKYKLWLEWNKTCPYTNTPIDIEKLFTDEVSIVYIHPWERFFNDSDRNKTLCMSFFKKNVMNKTPYEYFTSQPSGVWEQVKTRVLEQLLNGSKKYSPFLKFKHFIASSYVNDHVSREFDDQHPMALKLKRYLNRISPEVVASRGNATSSLRRKWGISALKEFNQKARHFNSRETATIALVTGLNEHKYLEELRYWNRYEPLPYRGVFPTPWTQFTRDVDHAYKTISVSVEANHQVARRIAQKSKDTVHLTPKGKLLKESYYGKCNFPKGSKAYHIPKSINSLNTAKQVSKIVDDSIRELVYDQIDLCGGFINGRIPKHALFIPNEMGWETKIFLPNKRGDKVPVRSVRIREKVSNAVQLSKGSNIYVNPRNNHHVLIYRTIDNELQEHVVTFWEAVQRIRKKESPYQLPLDGRMIMSTLHINDCFILGLSHKEIYHRLNNGVSLWEHVYRVQRISSKYYEFRHVYDLNVYDQTYPNYIRILNFGNKKTGWLTHNPFKVSISILGDITPFYKLLKVPEMH